MYQCIEKNKNKLRSTFRTCWVSMGTRKCISFSKLVNLSLIETLFYCRCFLIFRNKIPNFNFSEPQNSFFKEITLPMFFFNFLNHKLSPFGRWSMNVVNCFEIFCMHFCVFGRIKKLQILFIGIIILLVNNI